MTRKQRRITMLLAGLLLLGGATALILTAFQENLVFFYSPTDIAEQKPPDGRGIRLGGLVEEDSVERLADGLTVQFRVTDLNMAVPVSYNGILPDLFREGQGVVVEGTLGADGHFTAREVLAKHDENYMPPEVAEAIKRAGQWKADGAAAGEAQ